MQCPISSNIKWHCFFYAHNHSSIKSYPLKLIDYKSTNTWPISSATVVDCLPTTTAMIPPRSCIAILVSIKPQRVLFLSLTHPIWVDILFVYCCVYCLMLRLFIYCCVSLFMLIDQAKTGFKRSLWEEVALEVGGWLGNSVDILFVYYFFFCLLLCLIVDVVCFIPSWWLIIAFVLMFTHSIVWFRSGSRQLSPNQDVHMAIYINHNVDGYRELWAKEQRFTRLFSLFMSKQVLNAYNEYSIPKMVVVPTYKCIVQWMCNGWIYREKGDTLPGLTAGGQTSGHHHT